MGKDTSPLLIERRSQTTVKGVMQTVLLLTGESPNDVDKRATQRAELKLSSRYTVRFIYCPNGRSNENFISLYMVINSVDGSTASWKVKSSVISPDGKSWFHFRYDIFTIIPSGSYRVIRKVAPIADIRERQSYFSPDSTVKLQVTLTIDTNHSQENIPRGGIFIPKTARRIKRRIRKPTFGDTQFIVGGVKMYGHRDVMVRHNNVFETNFAQEIQSCYELPYFNARLFRKLLIDCYLKEKKCREKCSTDGKC